MQKRGRIISMGWNGTRAGECNECEDETGGTLPGVVHAEENLLRKLITSNETSTGAELFITLCPCIRCAEKIVDAGITKVYFVEMYRSEEGIEYLRKHNIEVTQLSGNLFNK